MIEAVLLDYAAQLADPFVNPAKRVFVGYLVAAAAIAFVAFAIASRHNAGQGDIGRGAGGGFFDKAAWWSPSARADYKLMAVNRVVMTCVSPALLTQLALAALVFEWLHIAFGGRPDPWPAAPGWAIALGFTLTWFVVDDATKYAAHRLLHRWPVLWAFHKVHHSAESLNPLTVYRTHPVEGVLFALRAALSQGVVVALFVFFFGPRADLATVFGANLFLFAFNATGSNLRHSHVWIGYWPWLEHILISPAQHQIHHSRETRHRDANFGVALAVWDWLGGSLRTSRGQEGFALGLAGESDARAHCLWALYSRPFVDSGRSLVGSIGAAIRLATALERRLVMATAVWKALRNGATGLAVAIGAIAIPHGAVAAEALHVYSHRQQFLIQPFIEAFTEATGVDVMTVFASKGLAQRLQAEGKRSPADLVLTVDVGRLSIYADKDLLAPVSSDVLQRNIPAHLRDSENRWFGLSKRARVIAVAKGRVGSDEIARVEDLADPKWRGRICTRPGSHVYNRALMASMIVAHGEAAAEDWAHGFVANLARRPQGNDRAQIKAIFEGECDIALVNNYYFGKLKSSDNAQHRAWADAVEAIFPNQGDRGSHINISGGGVAKHSKNKDLAVRFLEFLTEQTAQRLYGEINYEFPVNPQVSPTGPVADGAGLKEDRTPISKIAELAPKAQMIVDRVGW